MGSSIVKRTDIAARERKGGLNLDLTNIHVWGQELGGMKIHDLVPKLRESQRYQDKPDY